ncbi:MAG TPA: single-stranded-DNA-specific exonuclease RecJ [Vicinamibacterales bacterium]|nr:single-stranded-DNA-specific exonuclease RecJ [Vicinamibacterales bacterium]
MRPYIWDVAPCDDAAAATLAAALTIPPIVARLLCMRGLAEPEAAERFLQPSLSHLHDPFRLSGMAETVGRLLGAIARKERIAIHGDYDVDGVTSTVIMRRALEMLGADVIHFIPERLTDGYGLQPATVEKLHALGAVVIVSVDCGIRGEEAARRARDLGIDLIVTDHHEPDTTLPPAFAIINPKRADCTYPDKNLAGVGVALKLVHALCLKTGHEKWLPAFVKIAAIGTLADVVPLVGENRVIAKLGLEMLSTGRHTVGLRSLLEASGLTNKTIDGFHVSFLMAPRINAAGRMSTPDIATRLLLAIDEGQLAEARALAQQLNDENTKRQAEEAEILAQARKAVESDPSVGAHNVLVVAGQGWHRGVIGIVASKLVDHFNKPAVVLSIEGGVGHGSCRSIPAFDMLGALERCADLFDRFGGHKQAAGLTLPAANVPEFRRRINDWADSALDPRDLLPRLRIDAALPLGSIDSSVIEALGRLGPYGAGNRKPVFHAGPVQLVNGPRTIKERHLKMSVRQEGRTFPAIAWRFADRLPLFEQHRTNLELAFSLDKNEFNGEAYVELTLADVRGYEAR